jgi:hypothetical protein
MLHPFIVFTANNQNVSAIALPINNSYDRLVAQMENYDSYNSYLHYVDIFSDMSRNTTSSSSSDLSEDDNTALTEDDNTALTVQDNTIPTEEIVQDNNINTEADSGDETTVDTNQSSSSLSSSSDLFENDTSIEAVEDDNTTLTEEDSTLTEEDSTLTEEDSTLTEEDSTTLTEELAQDNNINTEANSGDETTVDTNQSSSTSP